MLNTWHVVVKDTYKKPECWFNVKLHHNTHCELDTCAYSASQLIPLIYSLSLQSD